jgi:hypothetical protein
MSGAARIGHLDDFDGPKTVSACNQPLLAVHVSAGWGSE